MKNFLLILNTKKYTFKIHTTEKGCRPASTRPHDSTWPLPGTPTRGIWRKTGHKASLRRRFFPRFHRRSASEGAAPPSTVARPPAPPRAAPRRQSPRRWREKARPPRRPRPASARQKALVDRTDGSSGGCVENFMCVFVSICFL